VKGLVQVAKAAPSTEHSKIVPLWGEEKVKAGVVLFVRPLGPEPIVVSGRTMTEAVAVPVAGSALVAE